MGICTRLFAKKNIKMAICYNNLGLDASTLGDYDKAMELFKKSLAIRKKLGDKAGMGRCYHNMSAVAQASGDSGKMRDCACKAIRVFDDIGVPVHPSLREAAGS